MHQDDRRHGIVHPSRQEQERPQGEEVDGDLNNEELDRGIDDTVTNQAASWR